MAVTTIIIYQWNTSVENSKGNVSICYINLRTFIFLSFLPYFFSTVEMLSNDQLRPAISAICKTRKVTMCLHQVITCIFNVHRFSSQSYNKYVTIIDINNNNFYYFFYVTKPPFKLFKKGRFAGGIREL
jgi:hypothetical protein